MASPSILDRHVLPQAVCPLFTQLPSELRLMIYKFVFVGCRANVWLDCYMKLDEAIEKREGRRKLYQRGQLCYEHFEGGFGLLTTCHIVHIEAFPVYWSETVLKVQGYYRDLQRTCSYLPFTIKENLRHLRDVALPPEGRFCHETHLQELQRTPQLLRQFPRLVSCQFQEMPRVHGHDSSICVRRARRPPSLPDSENLAQSYHGFGRFRLKHVQSLATYLEREMGVKPSCGVNILSMATCAKHPDRYGDSKNLYLNWTTGMVYETTTVPASPRASEDAYQKVISAEKGSEWSSSDYIDN